MPDAFQSKPAKPRTGPRCSVGALLESIDPKGPLRRLPEVILPDSGWTSTQIAEVLNVNGVSMKAGRIQHHRRRSSGNGCACP